MKVFAFSLEYSVNKGLLFKQRALAL
jgi:hypothetical protein